MKSNRLRTCGALAVAAVTAVSLAGCGSSDSGGVTTVVVTKTVGPSSSAPASSSAVKSAGSLKASFDKLNASLSSPVGLALAPVGGGDVTAFGDLTPRVAWSTIKVPLAVAAERKNGQTDSESSAIINSDNAAAESLWSSLGSPEEAAAAVTKVLREGGDKKTTVPSARQRPEFTIFGQTQWALADAVTFTANLPCLPGAGHVVGLMGQVAGNQQWGIEAIPNRKTAVKGGWGPETTGGYLVRQIGIITLASGKQVAVAMQTQTASGSDAEGAAILSQVGTWLGKHLTSLPAGKCA